MPRVEALDHRPHIELAQFNTVIELKVLFESSTIVNHTKGLIHTRWFRLLSILCLLMLAIQSDAVSIDTPIRITSLPHYCSVILEIRKV